ncbi:MAG TPA: hypothetical protein VGH01_04085 [Jatrophihabitantaceae bacterium]|jgi:hypothetical protein
MTRMSLVHCGVDAWVAVAALVALLDAAVDGTEPLLGRVETEDEAVFGVVDELCVPDPEVVLEHPASAAPATSTDTVSCAPRRIIALSSSGPDDFV